MANIIFDFDGTIADTLEIALKFLEENAKKFQLQTISREDFRSKPLKKTLKEIGLSNYKLPSYILQLKSYLKKHISNVEVFEGIKETVKQLKFNDHKIFILSSNSSENIKLIMDLHGMTELFEKFICDSSIFGKHILLKRMLKDLHLELHSTIYVGDELRDLKACQKIGMNIILVSWGWNNLDLLKTAGPKHIANSPEALVGIINSHFSN